MHKSAITRAINAFEIAVTNKAFQGTIPLLSSDREEQLALDQTHLAIEHNYIKARAKLELLLENCP